MPLFLIREALRFARLFFQPAAALRAENVVLRRQLAHFLERGQRPRRSTDAERMTIALACRLFDWRSALVIVQPATLIRWQRELGRMFWRRKCLRGRPAVPANIRELIVRMDSENPSWGEQRIADELLVKLGVRVSARTVGKYLRSARPRGRRPRRDQRWSTFIRNHARAIVACDFAVSMTLSFEIVYIFVAMELGSRRILHVNTTRHPTADWTAQQLRCSVDTERHRYLLHDRDAIFSAGLDASFERLGVTVLKSPPRSPKANAFCERLIGTLRRECLDWIIPLSENHLQAASRLPRRGLRLGFSDRFPDGRSVSALRSIRASRGLKAHFRRLDSGSASHVRSTRTGPGQLTASIRAISACSRLFAHHRGDPVPEQSRRKGTADVESTYGAFIDAGG